MIRYANSTTHFLILHDPADEALESSLVLYLRRSYIQPDVPNH